MKKFESSVISIVVALVLALMAACFVGCSRTQNVVAVQSEAVATGLALNTGNVAEAADSESVTITYTVSPEWCIDKTVNTQLSWLGDSEWSSGKTPGDYLSVTTSGSSISVRCIRAFGDRIRLAVQSNSNHSVVENGTFGYYERINDYDLSFMAQTCHPYEFDPTWVDGQAIEYYEHAYISIPPVTSSSFQGIYGSNQPTGSVINFVSSAYTTSATKSYSYTVEPHSCWVTALDNSFIFQEVHGSIAIDRLDYIHVISALCGDNFLIQAAALQEEISDNSTVQAKVNAFNSVITDCYNYWSTRSPHTESDQEWEEANMPWFTIHVTITTDKESVVRDYGFYFDWNDPIFLASAMSLSGATFTM